MSAPVRFRAYGWADRRRRVQRAEAIVAARLDGFSQPKKADLRAELARAVRNTAELEVADDE